MWIILTISILAVILIWIYVVQYIPEKKRKKVTEDDLQKKIYKIVHLTLDERIVHAAAERVIRRSDLSTVPGTALPLLKKDMVEGLKFYFILRAKYPEQDIVLVSDAIYELVLALENDMKHFRKIQKYLFGKIINIELPKELIEYRDGVYGNKVPHNIQQTLDLIIQESHGHTHALLSLDKRINNKKGFIWETAR